MTVDPGLDVTQLLGAWQAGEGEAFERLVEVVYEELHEIASRQLTGERPDHTLQATGLVQEAYLRLAGHDRARWHGRLHFFAVAARVMRRVLVDHARGRKSLKRGGHLRKISLTSGVEVSGDGPEDLLEVDEALSRLEELDPAGPLAAAPEPAPSARPVLGSPVAPGTRGAYAISHCHFMCYWDFPYKRE